LQRTVAEALLLSTDVTKAAATTMRHNILAYFMYFSPMK